jgi:hypothetical protein
MNTLLNDLYENTIHYDFLLYCNLPAKDIKSDICCCLNQIKAIHFSNNPQISHHHRTQWFSHFCKFWAGVCADATSRMILLYCFYHLKIVDPCIFF